MQQTFDILIRNATIIDGTGTERFAGDIGIAGDRIARMGDLRDARGEREINADGRVAAPGFIDAHTHDDRILLSAGDMTAKVSQGVTTVVGGNCGISLAPMPRPVKRPVTPPLDLLDDSGDWYRYRSFGDYLDALREQPAATNCAMLVGHTTLRAITMDGADPDKGVGFLVGGVMGVILEVTLIRRMYHRPLDTLLVTFGVGLLLQQAARDIFGAPAVNVIAPSWLSGGVEIFGAVVPKTRLFILALAVVCVVALIASMKYTPMGRRIRAVVQNRDLAETVGISSRRTDITTFFLGSGLAGLAGVALTLIGSTSPTIGQSYLIDAFLVVVIGGLGRIEGAVLAAVALGLLNSFIEYSTTASIAKVIVFVLIVIFLQVRPQGLFAVKTRSLV